MPKVNPVFVSLTSEDVTTPDCARLTLRRGLVTDIDTSTFDYVDNGVKTWRSVVIDGVNMPILNATPNNNTTVDYLCEKGKRVVFAGCLDAPEFDPVYFWWHDIGFVSAQVGVSQDRTWAAVIVSDNNDSRNAAFRQGTTVWRLDLTVPQNPDTLTAPGPSQTLLYRHNFIPPVASTEVSAEDVVITNNEDIFYTTRTFKEGGILKADKIFKNGSLLAQFPEDQQGVGTGSTLTYNQITDQILYAPRPNQVTPNNAHVYVLDQSTGALTLFYTLEQPLVFGLNGAAYRNDISLDGSVWIGNIREPNQGAWHMHVLDTSGNLIRDIDFTDIVVSNVFGPTIWHIDDQGTAYISPRQTINIKVNPSDGIINDMVCPLSNVGWFDAVTEVVHAPDYSDTLIYGSNSQSFSASHTNIPTFGIGTFVNGGSVISNGAWRRSDQSSFLMSNLN